MNLLRILWSLIQRDLRLAWRSRGELLNPIFFLVLVIALFPLGVGPEGKLLARIATGTIWVAALLATMLSLDLIFRSDVEDGSMEQMFISQTPLSLIVLGKVATHWLVTGLPLVLLAPLLAILMHMPREGLGVLLQSLALGTPVLSLIGSVGVALTVGIRKGGMLLSLLVLPLYVPVLIFGTAAVENAIAGMSPAGPLLILAAMLMFALTLAPLTAAWALRIALS